MRSSSYVASVVLKSKWSGCVRQTRQIKVKQPKVEKFLHVIKLVLLFFQ